MSVKDSFVEKKQIISSNEVVTLNVSPLNSNPEHTMPIFSKIHNQPHSCPKHAQIRFQISTISEALGGENQ
jgi:hypothetical protein